MKLENFLLFACNDPDYKTDEICLADFGLAKVFDNELTLSKKGVGEASYVGNPNHMAPELIWKHSGKLDN